MKYFSEKLNKTYDTVEALELAEKEYEEKQNALAKATNEVSNEKRKLATAVEAAEKNLADAYAHYDTTIEECKKIQEEANKKITEKLSPAKKLVKEAEKRKYDALVAFNNKYGVYTTTYTGKKAYDEFKRTCAWMDEIFNALF